MLPLVSDLSEAQYRLLVLFQSVTAKHAEGAIPALQDGDVADGAAAAAATLETARKGIIYEHQAVSVPAQRLSSELSRVVAELISQTGSQQARLERDAAAALRRLEQSARTAAKALDGEPLAYLRLLKRMLKDTGDRTGVDQAGAPSPSGGLIIPPY